MLPSQRFLAFILSGLALAPAAHAVVWADDITDATVLAFGNDARFAGVGEVDLNGYFGTGTFLGTGNGKGWMITANHVLGTGETGTFSVPGLGSYAVTGRFSYEDITVAEITSSYTSLLGAYRPKLNLGTIGAGDAVVSAGFGLHSSQAMATPGETYDGRRRGFQSVSLGTVPDGTDTYVVDRFDRPGDPNKRLIEGFGAPGDSGSMLLRERDGAILGVLTSGDPERYGGENFYSALRPEISAQLYAQTGISPVPEPVSLVTLGLGALAALRRRRG